MKIHIVEKIEVLPFVSLIPYANNARINGNAVPKVKASILKFGFNVPIVLENESNVVVCGHTRLRAAEELCNEGHEIKYVPCVRVGDLTEEQIKAYRLADNKTAEAALWDYEKLEREMAEIGNKIKMEDFGFIDPGSPNMSKFFEPNNDPSAAGAGSEPEPEPAVNKPNKPFCVKCPHCGEVFEA